MRTRGRGAASALAVAGMALACLGVTAAPAVAKMPAFDLVVSPERPAPGETVTVRVTIYQDRERNEIARGGLQSERLENLVGVYPSASLTDAEWKPLASHDLLTLHHVAPSVYEGSFVAPDEGSVVVAPFPGVMGYDPEEGERLGYPAPVTVTVGSSSSPTPWWLVAPLLGVVFGGWTVRRVRQFA